MVAFYWIVRRNFEAIWLALSQRAYHWLWAIYSALHSMYQHVFTWQHTGKRANKLQSIWFYIHGNIWFYSNGSGGLIIVSNIINVADNNQYPFPEYIREACKQITVFTANTNYTLKHPHNSETNCIITCRYVRNKWYFHTTSQIEKIQMDINLLPVCTLCNA